MRAERQLRLSSLEKVTDWFGLTEKDARDWVR